MSAFHVAAVAVLWLPAVRAAPYSCQEAEAGSIEAWPQDQRDMCCINEQIGCPELQVAAPPPPSREAQDGADDAGAPVMTFGPTTAAPEPASSEEEEEGPSTTVNVILQKFPWIKQLEDAMNRVYEQEVNGTGSKVTFNCSADVANIDTWGPFRRHYCCKFHDEGCEKGNVAFDCEAGQEDWQKSWGMYKTAFCCIYWGMGCKGSDEVTANATKSGAAGGGLGAAGAGGGGGFGGDIGGGIGAAGGLGGPGRGPGGGGPMTSPAYDCESGFANFKEGWSDSKRQWCCENEGRACSDEELTTRRPDKPYNCEENLRNWEHTWSDAKQGWCCERWERTSVWPNGADQHCCDLVGRGCEAGLTTSPPKGGAEGLNCQSGIDDWQNLWTVPKKEYCCRRFKKLDDWPSDTRLYCCKYGMACPDGEKRVKSLPFDCEAGYPSWKTGWSADKKDWCCANYNRGCPKALDCKSGSWKTWDQSKRGWCCQNEGKCGDAPEEDRRPSSSPTPRPNFVQPDIGQAKPSPLGWVWPWSWPTSAPSGREPTGNYSCRDGPSFQWSSDKKDWCCYHEHRGCERAPDTSQGTTRQPAKRDTPYDCDTGYSNWKQWDEAKKEWCCENQRKACEEKPITTTTPAGMGDPFDCDDGYKNWHKNWDQEKIHWCCRFKGRACTPKPGDRTTTKKADFDCSGRFSIWDRTHPDERVEYCCKHEGKGCLPFTTTTEEPRFNCENGLKSWEISWPVEKVHWCCDVMGVCPGNDKAKEEPYNCNAGFTADAILHPDAKVKWCCKHRKRGCSLDDAQDPGKAADNCKVGLSNWQNGWSIDKKTSCCKEWDANEEWPTDTRKFCCMYKEIGCPEAKTTTTVATTTPSLFDCEGGPYRTWADEKKAACCVQFRKQGKECPAGWDKLFTGPVPDPTVEPTATPTPSPTPAPTATGRPGLGGSSPATTTTSKTQVSSDEEEPTKPPGASEKEKPTRDRTTTTTALGKVSFNCQAGVENAQTGWSSEKMTWCCTKQGVGCTTTSAIYNCNAGYDNWVMGWSEDKKDYCCETAGKGCTGPTRTTATTTSTTTVTTTSLETTKPQTTEASSLPYDCDAGFGNWEAGWSNGKKDYCCKTAQRGCVDGTTTSETYNCEAGYDNWRMGWSSDKKSWCCKTEGRGCDDDADDVSTTTQKFDCKDGYDNWRMGWPAAKKKYCCDSQGRGCEDSDSKEEEDDFDCQAGIGMWLTGWSEKKKAYCCKTKGFPCSNEEKKSTSTSSWDPDTFTGPPGVPSTSKATTTSEKPSTSSTSPPYSCKGNVDSGGSKPYDCHEGLWNWADGWTDKKKEYCCTNELLWCPEWAKGSAPEVDTSDWSEDQKDYCCRTEKVGCTASEGMSKFDVLLRRAAVPIERPVATVLSGCLAAAVVAAALGAAAYRRGVRAIATEGRSALATYAPMLRERGQPPLMAVFPEPDQADAVEQASPN